MDDAQKLTLEVAGLRKQVNELVTRFDIAADAPKNLNRALSLADQVEAVGRCMTEFRKELGRWIEERKIQESSVRTVAGMVRHMDETITPILRGIREAQQRREATEGITK